MLVDFSKYAREEQLLAEEELYNYARYTLLKQRGEAIPPIKTRNSIVEELTESYFAQFQEFPSNKTLYLLCGYLLLDETSSMNKKKQGATILSKRQLRHRNSKEVPMDAGFIDGQHEIVIGRATDLPRSTRE